MREIDEAEAATRFSAILDDVCQGEEILITRNSKSIARLVPTIRKAQTSNAEEAMVRIRKRAEALKLGPFDWEKWKSERDVGRR
ncbi:MAG TPA: type II toxin-antitoxin system Phd/YefM family antitoxin [Terriglobales bacterium]|nr:type II toxin-antitoxin system Phd/YefM family antitoxin [Terriglobales bacterium]